MTQQQPPPSTPRPATMARVIHAAITAGIAIIFAVLLFLTRAAPELAARSAAIIRWVGVGILVGSALISFAIRSRIAPPLRGSDPDHWWRANQAKAVISWAAAEGGGLAAIAIGWLIGQTGLMALGAGVALALLFVSRPGALEGSG